MKRGSAARCREDPMGQSHYLRVSQCKYLRALPAKPLYFSPCYRVRRISGSRVTGSTRSWGAGAYGRRFPRRIFPTGCATRCREETLSRALR